MTKLALALALCWPLGAQPWADFIDETRAVDWSTAGFTIPAYDTACSTQPSLTPDSAGSAAANTTAIQNALASCDATHNVVNIAAGTFYVDGWTYGSQGKQVVRGAGPTQTHIIFTTSVSCGGLFNNICMVAGDWTYGGNTNVLPPSGTRQCEWTGGLSQGSTSLTLNSCGGAPPLNETIILDQANDTSDTSGIYSCNAETSHCTAFQGSFQGRSISGVYHSHSQTVYTTGVTDDGGGSYTVTISPPIAMTNFRTGKNAGAWWPGFVENMGLENISLDQNSEGLATLMMFSCYQCWVRNVRFINSNRSAVWMYQSMQPVVRDSYFYSAEDHFSQSYTIEGSFTSGFLIENNIFQQVTVPMLFQDANVGVAAYNYSAKTIFSDGSYTWGIYASHNAGNDMNLFEGNNTFSIVADNGWGSSNQFTMFRNFLTGRQPGTTNTTIPILFRSFNRATNFVGNILGQPSYHDQYETYATSSSGGSGGSSEVTSIYSLGWGGTGPGCDDEPGQSTPCDPLTRSSMSRWGNYDTVNAAVRWNSTEAAPGAITYADANFSTGYFDSLAHTLPSSLYLASEPSWWPVGKPWPPIGPDVSSGNVGRCTSGTYSGWQSRSSGECAGGSFSASNWDGHANTIPAQDCYLDVMGGPLDGTGSVLDFDANDCYQESGAAPASRRSGGASRTAGASR